MSDPPPKRAAWFRYTDNASLGIEIAIAVSIGAVGGIYLEEYVTHWSPWTTLIGLGVGLGAAVKAVLRTARAYQRELAGIDEGESAPPPEHPQGRSSPGPAEDETRS